MIAKKVCQWFFPRNLAASDEELTKILWLSRMRWLAITAQVLSLWLGMRLGQIDSMQAPLYAAIVACIACFNRWVIGARPQGSHVLLVHMMLDLLFLTALLSLAGGCANPMMAMIFLHAALGPMLLSGKKSIAYLTATCVSLTVVCFMTPLHAISHLGEGFSRILRLGSEIFVVCAIWGVTTWLVETLAKLRSELQRVQIKQQRSSQLQALGTMASSFCHEFATPLNTANMRLERGLRLIPVAESRLSESRSEMTAALAAIQQCEKVLRGLFDTQLDADSVRFSEFDLSAFAENLCARWSQDRDDVDIRVSTTGLPQPFMCLAPKILLSKTMLDLLDNAAEASQICETNQPRPIEVAISRDDSHVQIAISDRGGGLAETLKDRLGEPFSTTRSGGTGLGLYTAHGLMDAIGGMFDILPRSGGGTTVLLKFPQISGGRA
jgi:two-component system sensor histidine kinase RegB